MRVKSSQVSEAAPDGTGRVYRRKRNNSVKDRSEWIAVPVPDAGIPLEVIEAARRTVRDYTRRARMPPAASGSSPARSPAARCADAR